jgi:integrase/recombinase XerD
MGSSPFAGARSLRPPGLSSTRRCHLTSTIPSTSVVAADPVFSDAEQLALAGFLAGYRGVTRDAHALDLRQFVAWCDQHDLRLFEVRRADIECFARDLEERGRARATVGRRRSTIAGFYRYAEEEGVLAHSPAAHVRRPRLDYESHAVGLDRNEVGALLVAAGLGGAAEHALVSLLAINGLRVSEALGADIEALGLERGHRTMTILRQGGKVVTIPLAPRTARAIDLVIGGRPQGPIFLDRTGRRLDRHAAWRIVRRLARRAGITKPVGPHTLWHAFIAAVSMPACRSETCKRRPHTPTRAPPCATTGPGSPLTGTPPTSWPPSSPAQPDRPPTGRRPAHRHDHADLPFGMVRERVAWARQRSAESPVWRPLSRVAPLRGSEARATLRDRTPSQGGAHNPDMAWCAPTAARHSALRSVPGT